MISLASYHAMPEAVSIERIENTIHTIRGLRVMLDADLAGFYGVTTKVLNQAVRRNLYRFPKDFAFQLERQELTDLRSQSVTSSLEHGGRRYAPWVFTEHGAVMLASVLNSAIAIAASVEIVRTFGQLRAAFTLNASDLIGRLLKIEHKIDHHDEAISQLFGAIQLLVEAPAKSEGREMGFHVRESAADSLNPIIYKCDKSVRYPKKKRTPKAL